MKFTVQSFALIVVAALSPQAFAHDKHGNRAHDKGKASAAKAVKGGFLGKGDGRMKKLTGYIFIACLPGSPTRLIG